MTKATKTISLLLSRLAWNKVRPSKKNYIVLRLSAFEKARLIRMQSKH
jgi:hypothetical protein